MPVATRSQTVSARNGTRLSWWARLYIYGLHGVAMEVLYTAIWEVARLNYKAIGFSSIWAVFMYGGALLGIEQFFIRFAWRWHFIVRGLIYTIWIYLVELVCGVLLDVFDAKPWDYKLFNLNIAGHVTLEYAPMWFVLGLATEAVIVKIVLNTSWLPIEDGGHHQNVPAHAISVSHRSFFAILPAVVALLAYIYFFLVAAYNNGEYYHKPSNELYRSID